MPSVLSLEVNRVVGRQLPAIRRRYAAQILQRDGTVTCRNLELLFHVSPATARRDLNDLVRRGVALRVYGGAVLPEPRWGRGQDVLTGSRIP